MARSVRARAARAVAEVLAGRALDGPLERERAGLDRPADRGLLAALCFGSLRHYYSHRFVLRAMLQRPGQKLPRPVEALLLVGLEQIEHLRVPPHAAVAETVAAARELGQARSTGLINALLRRFLREGDALLARRSEQPAARHDHPAWLLERLREDWPDDWRDIVANNNRAAPMWLRVNLAATTRPAYLDRVRATGEVEARAGRWAPGAVRLDAPRPVQELPGFEAGEVAVQDQSAQLAAPLVAPQARMRVLDACAAPGGKTAALLEAAPGLEVVAVDSAEERLARLRENLARQGHEARIVCRDLTAPGALEDLGQFDAALVDAPCTGTGVIRRHPDIKLLRRRGDVAALAGHQARIVSAALAALRPGGRLIYATCSVLRAENDAIVGQCLDRGGVEAVPIEGVAWGRATAHGRQILPGEDDSDGFYYACIVKT